MKRVYPRSTERIFCFPNVVWVSSKGGFRIVSDTLIIIIIIISIIIIIINRSKSREIIFTDKRRKRSFQPPSPLTIPRTRVVKVQFTIKRLHNQLVFSVDRLKI